MVARGGWVNTIHGNLELLDDEMAKWFAKVQGIYAVLQATGRTKTFGGIPGDVRPYGFGSLDNRGAIYTVVNPAQSVEEIELPQLSRIQTSLHNGRVIFRDAGFVPVLRGTRIKLGPGQMAAVGVGRYASQEFELGIQDDVRIPRSILPINATFAPAENNVIETTIVAPLEGDLRILFQQRVKGGQIIRSRSEGASVGQVLKIIVEQDGIPLAVEINYDKQIWSGLSWGAGEIKNKDFASGRPITIRCSSSDKDPVLLEGHVYVVEY